MTLSNLVLNILVVLLLDLLALLLLSFGVRALAICAFFPSSYALGPAATVRNHLDTSTLAVMLGSSILSFLLLI
jgi:hypothetical protein